MGFIDSMKDIATFVGDSVEKGAKTVSATSRKIAEKSKIKREIATLEGDINTLYIEIGKKYFEEISEAPSEKYAEEVEALKAKTERIEKFRLLLMSLEEKQKCTDCGAEVYKEQNFCDKCGAKVVKIEAPEIEGYNMLKKKCPNCEMPADDNQAYCEHCGTKLD